MLPPRHQRQQVRQLGPNRRRVEQVEQHRVRLRQHGRRLEDVVDHDEPAQQQALDGERGLQPADADGPDGAQRVLARHLGHRVQVAQHRAQAGLVQQVRRRDEEEQLVEGIGLQAALVRQRREVAYGWLYEGTA